MENLKEQIFQATDNFVATLQQLAQQHAQLLLQETFSQLGSKAPAATTSASTDKPRGGKRGPGELDQLSQRFAQFVHANPGLRIEQINKELGTTTAELALPIRKLIASGSITVKGQKRSTAYFADKDSDKPEASGGSSDTPSAGKSSKKRSRTEGKSSKAKSRSKSRAKPKKA